MLLYTAEKLYESAVGIFVLELKVRPLTNLMSSCQIFS